MYATPNTKPLLPGTVSLLTSPAHTPSSDLQRHLLAGSVYVNAHADCPLAAGLAEASFWVFVLQDVQSALAHRSPLRLTFRLFDGNLHSLWEAEHAPSERSWIHRAIWLLAETITLCYGGPRVEAEGEEEGAGVDPERVKERIRAWESSIPQSSRPLYFSPSDLAAGRPFPVVWFTSPSHGMLSLSLSLFWRAACIDWTGSCCHAACMYGESTSPSPWTEYNVC